MKISRYSKKRAVAPVLATLLMIAVSVAMSVIIFMWSQGFLSQTSGAAGSQQGQQNLAAESAVSIDTMTATASTSSANGTMTIVVRNVGAVTVQLGTLTIQGGPSNNGLQTSVVCIAFHPSNSSNLNGSKNCSAGTYALYIAANPAVSVSSPLAKGQATILTVKFDKVASGVPALESGDIINVKVSTTVATFATQQFTVP